jgi:glycosyltransferase involved in cell wall biosynthesis
LLARGLRAHGVDTLVVTGAGTELARRLAASDIPAELVTWSAGVDPRVAVRLSKLLSRDTIVHAHDSHSHILSDAVARLRQASVVVTRRVAFPIRNAKRYQRASAVIAISAAVREELLRTGIEAAKIHVVPDAIDDAGADFLATRDARLATSSSPEHPEIVCVAALAHEKGIDILLEAAAILRATHPQVRWTVVGDGTERHKLETERRRLGLDDIVALPTATAAMSAASALRHATLAVQPSRTEGLGSAVLQALALGIPVIASDSGGLPDALAHGGGVLVPSGSPTELSGAVARLLDDPSQRARLGADGILAARWFSLDLLVERTLEVYRSVAHYPGSR